MSRGQLRLGQARIGAGQGGVGHELGAPIFSINEWGGRWADPGCTWVPKRLTAAWTLVHDTSGRNRTVVAVHCPT
ncbi:hypothetical protein Sar04_44170 [Salinispora arenicola]|uniref:Uncharacterized protein n=1 Tax=Salinispora arenicola TaxID=168697 RepID=A0ABQ4JXM3_SALAC|nr:hypothetical protein Sar04_44170 [Salinispora arenicola]